MVKIYYKNHFKAQYDKQLVPHDNIYTSERWVGIAHSERFELLNNLVMASSPENPLISTCGEYQFVKGCELLCKQHKKEFSIVLMDRDNEVVNSINDIDHWESLYIYDDLLSMDMARYSD